MEQAAIERLGAKSARAAIIDQISRDFNLAPFLARTYFEQVQQYFEQYYQLERDVGQLKFVAVSTENPPGRAVDECKRLTIRLTLDSPDDLVAMEQGVAAVRQSKIQRLTHEAYEQGALLTQEDLARLLCASRSTIKRDIKYLRTQGIDVPTRGQMKDIGRGVSHKAQIVDDWLAGYTFSQIEQRRWHSISSIERYCRDFHRVIRLYTRDFDVAEIRRSTGLSERLIKEYLSLYIAADSDNERLQQLLTEPDAATAEPKETKRGVWLS